MKIHYRCKTKNGIPIQAEDYSGDGIEQPYRLTAILPKRDGKPKYRAVQFSFESASEALNATFDLNLGIKTLKDYTSKLIEPENERYIKNL